MSKKHNFLSRLFRRAERVQDAVPPSAPESSDNLTGTFGPTICINGVLYRARLRAGSWESYGPPLGPCTEDA